MPKNALLIAGPVGLDLLDQRGALLGGAGAMAAVAAAGISPTQLWARVGDDFPDLLRKTLADRRIDDSGLIAEGESDCFQLSDGSLHRHGSALPEAEPHDPVDVACCAAIGLDASDGQRAFACFRGLPGADERLCLAAPEAAACLAEPAYLLACAQAADLLVLPARIACQALATDPMGAAKALIEAGATAVALSAGPIGGLFRYKNACGTWAAEPQTGKDDRHAGAVFAGCVAAQLCETGRLDLRGLKRALAVASAVAGHSLGDIGPRRLLGLDRGDYQTLFLRLRRNHKA
jgi:hypothetical protein